MGVGTCGSAAASGVASGWSVSWATMSNARHPTPTVPQMQVCAMRSHAFSSSRTLPGHVADEGLDGSTSGTIDNVARPSGGGRLEEVLHQVRDVLAPLPQRRQRDRQDVQPVEEVLAELAFRDHLPQVALGARDHAHVDRDRAACRPAARRPVLQDAQQLDLHRTAACRRCRRGTACRLRPVRSGPADP